MKNCFFARSCLLVGIVASLWMCSKEPPVAPNKVREPLYSVAKARNFYNQSSTTTRAIAEQGPLMPGNYSLDWEQAEVSLDSLLSSVDVPIEMQYRYYRYLQPEPDSVELVPIYSKLVVVKEHPTLLEGCYIRHLMPSRTMLREQPEFDYDALLNSRPKYGFSGVSLYTDLNGWPMCIGYYYQGELLVDAFLFDQAHTLEENIDLMYDLLGDLTVARCSKVETRTQNDGPTLDGGNIEEVVCIGEKPEEEEPEPEIIHEDKDDIPKPINFKVDTELGGEGGGGSSSSSSSNEGNESEENISDHNDKIKYEDEETKDIIDPLIDSISQDCMGKTLLDALDGVTITTKSGKNGYDNKTNTIHLASDKEYGFRDYVLLEELTHCYQHNRYGDMYVAKRLNAEIEAKVGWLLYRQRNPNQKYDKTASKWQLHAFYTEEGVEAMSKLALFHLQGVNASDVEYQNYYRSAAQALSTHQPDKNGIEQNAYATYTFSWDIANWAFTNLKELMIYC